MTTNEKQLTRRYLIWCYKTTKEELDKVDRYFTQLPVDDFILKKLKSFKEYKGVKGQTAYRKKVDDFSLYMGKKEMNILKKKFLNSTKATFHPEYQYLKNRFFAIEKSIIHFFGPKELTKIRQLYEEEMTRRILEAREHT